MSLLLKNLVRASSILFIVAALCGALLDLFRFRVFVLDLFRFHVFGLSSSQSFFGLMRFVFVAELLLAALGFLALTGQFLHQRHLLGWVGIVLTVGSFSIVNFLAIVASLGAGEVFPLLPWLGTILTYGNLASALGLILWALDLPTTTGTIRLQKVVMLILGVWLLLEPVVSNLRLSHPFTYIVSSKIIDYLLLFLLGISVWFYQDAVAVEPRPAVTDTNTPSEQLT